MPTFMLEIMPIMLNYAGYAKIMPSYAIMLSYANYASYARGEGGGRVGAMKDGKSWV